MMPVWQGKFLHLPVRGLTFPYSTHSCCLCSCYNQLHCSCSLVVRHLLLLFLHLDSFSLIYILTGLILNVLAFVLWWFCICLLLPRLFSTFIFSPFIHSFIHFTPFTSTHTHPSPHLTPPLPLPLSFTSEKGEVTTWVAAHHGTLSH